MAEKDKEKMSWMPALWQILGRADFSMGTHIDTVHAHVYIYVYAYVLWPYRLYTLLLLVSNFAKQMLIYIDF